MADWIRAGADFLGMNVASACLIKSLPDLDPVHDLGHWWHHDGQIVSDRHQGGGWPACPISSETVGTTSACDR